MEKRSGSIGGGGRGAVLYGAVRGHLGRVRVSQVGETQEEVLGWGVHQGLHRLSTDLAHCSGGTRQPPS